MVHEKRPCLLINDFLASNNHIILKGLDQVSSFQEDDPSDASWDIAEKQIQAHVGCMIHISSKPAFPERTLNERHPLLPGICRDFPFFKSSVVSHKLSR